MKRLPKLIAVLALLAPAAARADVIYDTLGMIGDGSYDNAKGNAIAGAAAFGAVYDLQVADDFVVPAGGFKIQDVAQGSLTFFGQAPQDIAIRIYQDSGGKPSETALYEKRAVADLGLSLSTNSFIDDNFGLDGLVIGVSGLSITLDPGTYWIDLQPIDESDSGDWYYQVRDLDSASGAHGFARDGKSGYPGGYDAPNWKDIDAGDFAMRIGGVVPEPSAVLMLIVGGVAALRRAAR